MAKATTKKVAAAAPVTAAAPAENTAAPAENTALEPVQLTIADLQLLARIMDLASRRGAFQAAELSQVGESYNKLAGFLAYVDSVQKKEAEEAGATSTEVAA